MSGLSNHDITFFLLSAGVLLGTARILGEVARRLHQPSVLGEILAGILLGPTILGALAPEFSATLFPPEGAIDLALEGFTLVAITLFLLVAGMEVDLSSCWRQGNVAIAVGVSGIVVPFAISFPIAWFLQDVLLRTPPPDPLVFSLFFATALTISALPVIAKILLDLNLYRTDLGAVIVAGAVMNDLIGWNIFGVILGMMDSGDGAHHHPARTILLTLAFAAAMLTVGRWLCDRALPWIQAHASWPGGVLGFILTLTLLSSAATEAIGIHAIFGAFLFGVAVGDSKHMRQRTRSNIEQFVSFIFAPIFFASIGLKVNFIDHFDPLLVLVVLGVATVGKVLGCGLAARWSGLPSREAWAIGFGMNARGAMEIILGLLALERKVIDEPMFVALVVMALVTSLSSGSMIQRVLKRKKPLRFTDFLTSSQFVAALEKVDRLEVIRELSERAVRGTALNHAEVVDMVWNREQLMSTGLENGLAIPHARVASLERPILAVGLSKTGVDFDSFDGQPARLIFLVLTPHEDNGAQIEILADIGRRFQDARLAQQAADSTNYTEFLALMRSHEPDERFRPAPNGG